MPFQLDDPPIVPTTVGQHLFTSVIHVVVVVVVVVG
jgi:hypothetical protein